MRDARNAQPLRGHTPEGFQEPTAYLPANMARSIPACMKTSSLPAAFNQDGTLRRTPKGVPSGTSLTMDRAVIANSRVNAAGARVLVVEDNRTAHAVSNKNDIALQRVPVEFRTVAPAVFQDANLEGETEQGEIGRPGNIGGGSELTLASLPVSIARLDWNQAITKGVRFAVSRGDLRLIGDEEFCEEVAIALTLGAARAADEALLSAILAASPSAFTLAKAASAGLALPELRGLVGTAGASGTIAEDGSLRAAGIVAELTADSSQTLIGAWDRAAIAIRDDIDIHFKRVGLNGGLEVIAWINLLPLVPDATKFWTVA